MRKKFLKSQRNNRKKYALICSMLAIVASLASGTTLAYLIAQSNDIVNTFQPTSVTIDITEEFEQNVKSNIKVQNTSPNNISTYVRLRLLCYWANESGQPIGTTEWALPANLNNSLDDNWFYVASDDYYYYKLPVTQNSSTTSLFGETSIILKSDEAGNKFQVLDILAQCIQAVPADAVKDAWGVTVAADGTISK